MKDDLGRDQERRLDELEDIGSIVGTGVGVVTAFMLAGGTWGWLCMLVLAPIGAAVGRFCGKLLPISVIETDNVR